MVSRQKKKKATELDHIVSSERGNKRGRNSISGESFAFRSSLKAIEERRASDWLLAVHSGNPHTPRLPALPDAKLPLALSPSLSLSQGDELKSQSAWVSGFVLNLYACIVLVQDHVCT